MERNNIDKLFREHLGNYGEHPEERVWTRLEGNLKKQKRRRNLVPLWWSLGGVAAVLAVLLYLGQNPTTPLPQDTPTLVNQEDKVKDSTADTQSLNGIAADDKKNPNAQDTNTDALVVSDKDVQSPLKEPSTTTLEAKTTNTSNPRNSNATVATGLANKQEPNIREANSPLENSKKFTEGTEGLNTAQNAFASNESENKESKEEDKSDSSTALTTQTGKKSIYEVLEEQEEMPLASTTNDRWSVGPSIAPVYYNTLGSGSSLDPSFNNNATSGNVTMSYGLAVSYQMGKKWNIRSGVHKVSYGYNTHDVVLTAAYGVSSGIGLAHVEYGPNFQHTEINSAPNNTKLPPNAAFDATSKSPSRLGDMTQEFGYLEVPLELSYALLDSKLGIDLIGGVSSLFLTDNAVSMETQGLNTQIGEANNLNEVNFSSNIGLGINYRFTPKLELNLEPMFKYQLNTFSNTASDYKPYTLGVYSGINFKF